MQKYKFIPVSKCVNCPLCSMPLCLADMDLDDQLGDGESIPEKCPLLDLPDGVYDPEKGPVKNPWKRDGENYEPKNIG